MTSKKKKNSKVPQKVLSVKKTQMTSRKEQRKEKRKVQKQIKQTFYLKKHGKLVEETQPQIEESTHKAKSRPEVKNVEQKRKKRAKKVEKFQKKQRINQLKKANEMEDKTIKKLEKQLKLNKRKKSGVPASFKDEGLDYLLEVCDHQTMEALSGDLSEGEDLISSEEMSGNESQSDDEEEEEEEELVVDGEDDGGNSDVDQEVIDDDEDVEDEDIEDEDVEDEEDDVQDVVAEDEDDPASGDEVTEDDEPVEEEKKKSNIEFWEDIYGRTRDAQGNVVTSLASKYVPPALRAQAEGLSGADSATLARLSKQVKGGLNRLAESNLHVIARQIEDLYMSNSRNLMNECLCQIITSSLITDVMSPERLVMEHALLIAILHANVGTEVGANILQTLVSKYCDLYASTELDNVESKMLDNYLHLVSQLYAFQVVGHDLMFDILNQLSMSFKAKDVELILLVLRAVGFILRKDSPAQLKTLILAVQKKSNEMDKSVQSGSLSRVQFMLEIVLAIKNNNVKKIPNYDPTHQAHLQKISKTFLRPGCSFTPLNVKLSDLRSVNTRGRWWIVGSAWTGNDDIEKNPDKGVQPVETKFSAKLLRLAHKMRMNTEARKNLFCTLMSADDYLDAFERLIKVDKAVVSAGTRERDTAFVVLACCLKEPTFNRFYSQLAIKLGGFDRKYRMAIQCCIWDRIKDIHNLKKNEQANLAKFTSHVIKEKLLSLTCLKVIEFSELEKSLVKFVKTILMELLMASDQQSITEPFLVVAGYPKLSVFRDGLRLFMRHFMLRKAEKEGIDKEELKARIESAEKALMSNEKRMLL